MNFTSDNAAPVAPQVMAALQAANIGAAPSYGADHLMDQVRAEIRRIFEAPDAAVYLVTTGTAANALSLAISTQPWGAVFCHRRAHVEEDECGAPEFFTGGAKLVLIDGEHARMRPEALARALAATGQTGVHNVQRGMLSLTNSTENGTVYTPAQISELTALARAHHLPCHLDGARFANALVALGCTPAEMTWKAGIDVVSFGGTKNGLMGVEAVVIFDSAKAWEFELRRKRAGHLISKHRYLSAQMLAYLTDDLWLDLAQRANAAAQHLSTGIAALEGAQLLHPTEANAVFAAIPAAAHARAEAAGARYYLWPDDQPTGTTGDDAPLAVRLVCSWSTTKDEVDAFLAALTA